MSEHVEVRVTCGGRDEARRIADAMIDLRLAACVHLTPTESVYEWDGTLEHDDEIVLAAATRRDRLDAVVALVGELHSYDLPAVTVVSLDGSHDYLAWIDAQTG